MTERLLDMPAPVDSLYLDFLAKPLVFVFEFFLLKVFLSIRCNKKFLIR